MQAHVIKALADAFVALIRRGEGTTEANEAALQRLLDQLDRARDCVEFEFDDRVYPEPPEWPYETRRALICERFERYGMYDVTDPARDLGHENMTDVGDAIDDIADIVGELSDVVWLWEHTSQGNALWYFHFSYKTHWGEHLRELKSYLLALESAQ
ncbi:MAG: DUF5063 domain-containing protein [bacterium]|nr:DUF5063 domain-containing protein [bacterium]